MQQTLIAEKRRATPVCDQSTPTKGMNCPKTSDLLKLKITTSEIRSLLKKCLLQEGMIGGQIKRNKTFEISTGSKRYDNVAKAEASATSQDPKLNLPKLVMNKKGIDKYI